MMNVPRTLDTALGRRGRFCNGLHTKCNHQPIHRRSLKDDHATPSGKDKWALDTYTKHVDGLINEAHGGILRWMNTKVLSIRWYEGGPFPTRALLTDLMNQSATREGRKMTPRVVRCCVPVVRPSSGGLLVRERVVENVHGTMSDSSLVAKGGSQVDDAPTTHVRERV